MFKSLLKIFFWFWFFHHTGDEQSSWLGGGTKWEAGGPTSQATVPAPLLKIFK